MLSLGSLVRDINACLRQKAILANLFVLMLLVIFLSKVAWPALKICQKTNEELKYTTHRLATVKTWQALAKKGETYLTPFEPIDTADALLRIENLAKKTVVIMENIKPKETAVVKYPSFKYLKSVIELRMSGTEASLISFLAGLKKLGFLSRITDISIKVDPKNEATVKSQIKLEKIDDLEVYPHLIDLQKLSILHNLGTQTLKKDTVLDKEKRKLFRNPLALVSKNIEVTGDGRVNIIKDLNLVGIVQDAGIKAVIEDKKTLKTFFLNIDDMIAGMKVAEIKENEVVLEADGIRYNLVL